MFFLGIDGGGSKTRFLLVNERDEELFRVETGPSNWNSAGQAASREALAAGIAQLPGTPDVIGGGFAGAARPEAAAFYLETLRELAPKAQIRIETDALAAYAGAIGLRPGVLLIAGTGSIAVGQRTDGQMIRAGGWGSAFGDEGSGYWIGHEAIVRALRTFDTGEDAEFVRSITAALGFTAITDVVSAWSQGRLRVPEIALLTVEILRQYPSEPACRILTEAAGHLRNIAQIAAGKVGVPNAPMSITGSLGSNPLMQQLIGMPFQPPQQPPERGAIILARAKQSH